MVEWSGWDGLCGLGLWPHRYPHHKVFQCTAVLHTTTKWSKTITTLPANWYQASHKLPLALNIDTLMIIEWCWISTTDCSRFMCFFSVKLSTDIIFLLFLSVMPFQKLNWPFLGVGTHVSQPLGHMCPNPPSSSSAACVPTPLMTNFLWIKWALNKP